MKNPKVHGNAVNWSTHSNRRISVQQTPAGVRAHEHLPDGTTRSVSPQSVGVAGVSFSNAGGAPRATICHVNGVARDITESGPGEHSIVEHYGAKSIKRR
jgi:hypothetical protein